MAPTRSIRITLTEREVQAIVAAFSNYEMTYEGEDIRRDLAEDFKAQDRILSKISRARSMG